MAEDGNIRDIVRDALISMSEPEYQRFCAKLLPNTDNILGVRLPKLRKYAKEIKKIYGTKYLDIQAYNEYMEETLLQGMIIGNLKVEDGVSTDDIKSYIRDYIPGINNWSVCDSFCAGLKIAKNEPALMWEFIKPYFESDRAFDVRFGLVMLLNYYINDDHIDEVCHIFNNVGRRWADRSHEDLDVYYVKMGLAWAISVFYVQYRDKGREYLEDMYEEPSILDDFTYNKSLQKIVESHCVSDDEKLYIKSMKRRHKD